MRPRRACARRLDADHALVVASSSQRQRAPCTFGSVATALDAVAQTHQAVLVEGLRDDSAAAVVGGGGAAAAVTVMG